MHQFSHHLFVEHHCDMGIPKLLLGWAKGTTYQNLQPHRQDYKTSDSGTTLASECTMGTAATCSNPRCLRYKDKATHWCIEDLKVWRVKMTRKYHSNLKMKGTWNVMVDKTEKSFSVNHWRLETDTRPHSCCSLGPAGETWKHNESVWKRRYEAWTLTKNKSLQVCLDLETLICSCLFVHQVLHTTLPKAHSTASKACSSWAGWPLKGRTLAAHGGWQQGWCFNIERTSIEFQRGEFTCIKTLIR